MEDNLRNVKVDPEIIGHAIVDALNNYIRETLIPRCRQLSEIWDGPQQAELDRLKYATAAKFAEKWANPQASD